MSDELVSTGPKEAACLHCSYSLRWLVSLAMNLPNEYSRPYLHTFIGVFAD